MIQRTPAQRPGFLANSLYLLGFLGLFYTAFCLFPVRAEGEAARNGNALVSVALVGDSLVGGNPSLYQKALEREGLEALVSGVGSRALRTGWQCRKDGVLQVHETKIQDNCRPEGIEQVRLWRDAGQLRDAVIVALGTNDAALYPANEVGSRFSALARLSGSREIWIVTVAKLGGGKRQERVKAWNDAARSWCLKRPLCHMIEWASQSAARAKASYAADGVHLTGTGLSARASFIADTVAAQ